MREERSAIAKYRLSMSCRTSSERSLTAPRFSSCWSWIKSTFDLSSFISADTEDATIRYSLTYTKARIMAMFAAMATSLLSRPDSIATPCSVKAKGSAEVNWNIKSAGNLFKFLLTDWFSAWVGLYTIPARVRARSRKALPSGRSPSAAGSPESPPSRMLWTRGICPRRGIPYFCAIAAPPSFPNI